MTILALETSCDETAVAVLRGTKLLASEVASQIAAHQPYGGIVPEVASRNHLINAPVLLDRAIRNAGLTLAGIDAFAATSGPGLASSLMIGASIAKGLALGFRKPYLAINHLEGHLLSPFFPSTSAGSHAQDSREGVIGPNVSLVVSGGHTLLVHVRGLGDYRLLGRTQDDAAGEAFDKVAQMIGLGYPGGPEIERRARTGDPSKYPLPRSMIRSDDHDFSFSGLKTAVRYLLPKIVPAKVKEASPGAREQAAGSSRLGDAVVNDLCASFQAAVVEVLVSKTVAAAKAVGSKVVTVSGGVSCNEELRRQFRVAGERHGLIVLTAAPELCTDNAAMIAFAASLRAEAGYVSDVTEDIDPNLPVAV